MEHRIRITKRYSTATEHEYLCSCGERLLNRSISDARFSHGLAVKYRRPKWDKCRCSCHHPEFPQLSCEHCQGFNPNTPRPVVNGMSQAEYDTWMFLADKPVGAEPYTFVIKQSDLTALIRSQFRQAWIQGYNARGESDGQD